MKQFLVAIVVLGCTACAHKTPIAQTPKDPTPVATVTPAQAKPAAPQTVANNVTPPRVVAQPEQADDDAGRRPETPE